VPTQILAVSDRFSVNRTIMLAVLPAAYYGIPAIFRWSDNLPLYRLRICSYIS
jgi:hypothetical protein